jgi:hypothetical protein
MSGSYNLYVYTDAINFDNTGLLRRYWLLAGYLANMPTPTPPTVTPTPRGRTPEPTPTPTPQGRARGQPGNTVIVKWR